jgi:type I restriction enzyme S subunit
MLPIPPFAEQKRIVASIEQWFALIDTLEQNRLYLDKSIDIIKNKILSLAIRGQLVDNDPNDEPALKLMRRIIPGFKPIEDPNYADLPNNWTTCRLEDIVDYEQPSRYIVESTQYSDEYMTPVLTAGKTFVLGYTKETEGIYRNLPTIIFDDFTTDSRLVDFPFKVKSSAMKILQVNKEIDIKYVAHFMSVTRLLGDSHKRYWISTYSKVVIPIPPINEQRRIVAKVDGIFNLLENISQCIN